MSNLNWLYDSCASWLDAKHKTDFHARDDRLKLVAAANEKGLTVEQVSETIHQVNEDRRNAKRITEDASENRSRIGHRRSCRFSTNTRTAQFAQALAKAKRQQAERG